MDAELLCQFNKDMPPHSLGKITTLLNSSLTEQAFEASHESSHHAPRETLAWGRHYLAKHFDRPASAMHDWLGAQLDLFRTERGSKVNLIGPRGSAKSTIATLCYVLRVAVEGWEPYIWIVSDTKPQAQMHLENVKSELVDNRLLGPRLPALDRPRTDLAIDPHRASKSDRDRSASAPGSGAAAAGATSIDPR